MPESKTAYGKPPLGPGTWLTWVAVLFLSGFSCLPMAVKRAAATGLSTLYTQKLGRESRHVRVVQINLRACYPMMDEPAREALLHRYFFMLMMSVFQMPQHWWRNPSYLRKNLLTSGLEHVEEAKKEGSARSTTTRPER